ncbi:hypothetical protein [Corynebacterium bouchesdurhonense]|uniref:hypothetical protein n=1 Tax=Corynebacterium bouchesdurhonense TaxID=1720192 RepID=UPI00083089D8|nr:hypothetical protein [Corynebacterium bouchesdurhonense]
MNKQLGIRFALVAAVVALYLVASHYNFHNSVLAPASVVAVALIMFWPRRDQEGGAGDGRSARAELHRAQEEARR